MIWKEFTHIRNDELTVRLMVFPILAQIFILGYALVTEIRNTPVTVLDMDNTPVSRMLIEEIRSNHLFKWRGMTVTRGEVRRKLDNGTARIALVIPNDFARKLGRNEIPEVQMLVDGQDANSANVASGYVNAVISRWALRYFKSQLEKRGIRFEMVQPIEVNSVVLFNPMLKSTWYMMPALVVLLVTIVTSLLSGLSIVREKEGGTFEQLMVTPVEPIHVILGKTVPYLIIGVIELVAFLILVTLWFGIPFRGNFLVFILFGCIYMMSSLGIGIFTSTIARTPQQVLFLIWFILIFFILLSGFFIPVENMPHWVQDVSNVNPVRFFMAALRAMFLKGSDFAELWGEMLPMLLIGTTVFGASILFFHRRAK